MATSAAAVLLVGCLAAGGGAAAPGDPLRDADIPPPIETIETTLMTPQFELREVRRARSSIADDITHRGILVTADGPEIEVKIRPATPEGGEFNNQPRYELATYRLQAMFLDPADYVVPPTAIRSIPLERCRRFAPDVEPTFRDTDSVIVVLQYWLDNVAGPPDILDRERLLWDLPYARHVGNLNALTYIIEHRDSNIGNFLISNDPLNPRVFAVDNGIAFNSPESPRGKLWSVLRVDRVDEETIERLRAIDREALAQNLGVLAEFRIENGQLVSRPSGEPLSTKRGVRVRDDVVQFGLTDLEISAIRTRIRRLLGRYDKGKIQPLAVAADD